MPACDAFVELFVGRRFTSLAEFEETLSEYMKTNFVNFVVATSVRTANSRLRYDSISYRCVHCPRRGSQSKGIRKVSTQTTGCSARFHVRRRRGALMISSYDMEHNHPISRSLYERHPLNRHLTPEELNETRPLFLCNTSISYLKQYVADTYGKCLTTQDIVNIRSRIKSYPLTMEFGETTNEGSV
ncbi:hypothetical protein P879_05385 [Paragonimus westermani]|uniref:FAR1 domain-containing protein n=1 Tax=Paragonimus westermani TaxID=34504 RepID=A0A8T0DHZ2_9TREM|nr:hypothetical protein P879_05385 [Paragonimus westermani]